MKIVVNGENRDLPDELTIAGLLELFGVNPLMVAVELNVDIVARAAFSTTQLKEGDQVEIVHMVGGGA